MSRAARAETRANSPVQTKVARLHQNQEAFNAAGKFIARFSAAELTRQVSAQDVADTGVDGVGPVAEGRAMTQPLEQVKVAAGGGVGHQLPAGGRGLDVLGEGDDVEGDLAVR